LGQSRNMSATNSDETRVQRVTRTWMRNIVTSAWTIQTNKYEDMDEEHSDECMDDTLVYMSRANAIRANNMSATNMCAVL
jgi:hypothetical protein